MNLKCYKSVIPAPTFLLLAKRIENKTASGNLRRSLHYLDPAIMPELPW